MLIDWFTVAAQTFNFLLLIWLLKRFLYGPILQAMDRREARIAGRLQEAQQEQEAAKNEAAEYRRLNRELEEGRAERLREVTEEAAQHRKQLIDEGGPKPRSWRKPGRPRSAGIGNSSWPN
ncbi:MAG: hypothetical protein R2864_10965 [Syntrophotaleaceae bacterium]